MHLYCSDVRENDTNVIYARPVNITGLEELKEAVKYDHVVGRMRNNKRDTDSFIESDAVSADVDNTHSDDPEEWKTLDDVQDAFPDVEFYAIQSRNHMKQKSKVRKDGSVIHQEPRPKYHLYFPTSRLLTASEYVSILKRAAKIFPYIDMGAAKAAQFLYGVEHPEGEHIEGGTTLDQFVENLPQDKDQEGDIDADQPDTEQSPDWIRLADRERQVHWFLAWASEHSVEILKRYEINTEQHPESVVFCVYCPWEDEHSMDGGEKESVVIIEKSGKLCFLCRHSHGYKYDWNKYRAKIETDHPATPSQTTEPESEPIEFMTASQLCSLDIEPVRFIVPGFVISSGLTGLIAKPKIGKSWASLDMGIAVASGGDFLGRRCTQTDVLYMSLEDSYARLQDRLIKVLDGRTPPPGLALNIKSKNLDDGFIGDLQRFIKTHPETGLVIIDTFAKIRGQQHRQESPYAFDSRETGLLKSFADANHISVVIVHHTRKGETTDDPFQDVSGTNGIFGTLDTCLMLTKAKRKDKTAKLWTIGRDVNMEEYELEFDSKKFRWSMLGLADDVEEQRKRYAFEQSPVVKTVEKLVSQGSGSWSGTTTELMQAARYIIGHELQGTAQKVGRQLASMADQFYQYDAIEYDCKKGKNGNRIHEFRSQAPFK